MYREEDLRISIMDNVCYKKDIEIEDEGTQDLIGFKPDIHIKTRKR